MRMNCSYFGDVPGELLGQPPGLVEATVLATADFVVRQYEDMQSRYPFDVVEVEDILFCGVVTDDGPRDITPELEAWLRDNLGTLEMEEC